MYIHSLNCARRDIAAAIVEIQTAANPFCAFCAFLRLFRAWPLAVGYPLSRTVTPVLRCRPHWLFLLVREELLINAKIHPNFWRI